METQCAGPCVAGWQRWRWDPGNNLWSNFQLLGTEFGSENFKFALRHARVDDGTTQESSQALMFLLPCMPDDWNSYVWLSHHKVIYITHRSSPHVCSSHYPQQIHRLCGTPRISWEHNRKEWDSEFNIYFTWYIFIHHLSLISLLLLLICFSSIKPHPLTEWSCEEEDSFWWTTQYLYKYVCVSPPSVPYVLSPASSSILMRV